MRIKQIALPVLLAGMAGLHIGWSCNGNAGSDEAADLALLGALGSPAGTTAENNNRLPGSLAEIMQGLAESPAYQALLRQEAEESDPLKDSREDTTDVDGAPGESAQPANTIADAQAEMAARHAGESADPSFLNVAGKSADGAGGSGSLLYNGSNGYHWILLKRVTYCKREKSFFGVTWCDEWTTPAEFATWKAEGVDRGKREDTYITHLAQAPRADVEYIVFGGAGQQPGYIPFTEDGLGVDNALTGQAAGYKSGFSRTVGALWKSMDKNAMILRANDVSRPGTYDRLFHPARTFSAVAYDTKLNFQVGKAEKGKIERAYFRWLKSKAYANKVKLIYLAGSSRGGCLALRLAKLFRQDPAWRHIPLIVHSLDGTCAWKNTPVDDYVNQTEITILSPIISGDLRYAYYLNPQSIFAHREKMCMLHIVSGTSVAVPVVRQWAVNATNITEGWYQQQWMPFEHIPMGRQYELNDYTIEPFMQHLQRSYRSLLDQTGVCTEPVIAIGTEPLDPAIEIGGGSDNPPPPLGEETQATAGPISGGKPGGPTTTVSTSRN